MLCGFFFFFDVGWFGVLLEVLFEKEERSKEIEEGSVLLFEKKKKEKGDERLRWGRRTFCMIKRLG